MSVNNGMLFSRAGLRKTFFGVISVVGRSTKATFIFFRLPKTARQLVSLQNGKVNRMSLKDMFTTQPVPERCSIINRETKILVDFIGEISRTFCLGKILDLAGFIQFLPVKSRSLFQQI